MTGERILLLGATSDIGQAIVRRLRPAGCVLAARDLGRAQAFADELVAGGCTVHLVELDAADPSGHEDLVRRADAVLDGIDIAVVAFGVLGHGQGVDTPVEDAAAQVAVNATGGITLGLALARAMRTRGRGRIVVLSSVAGERIRRSNFVYGSAKAALDGFAQGLNDALRGTGVSVMVVRPGFVRSSMTEGLRPAPFATTPEHVAECVERGLRRGKRIVWCPAVLHPLFVVLRHLPHALFSRLPW